jgi:hypothetical protein
MDVEAPPGATSLIVKHYYRPRERGLLVVLLASQQGASLSSPLLIQNHGIHR